MLCFRRHLSPSMMSFIEPQSHSVGEWMICQIVHHPIALAWAFAMGFLWAKEEGDLIKWRWQVWRLSLHRFVFFSEA